MTMRTDLAIAAPLSAARPRPSARMAPAEGRAEAGAPAATAASRPRAEERSRWLYGPVVDFLFIGWTFINIHHYFIDNVIWRRDNPEARRYLFGSGAR